MPNQQPNQPLVSVLLVTYNSENYIEQTIKSILSQNLHNFELLILDNNSSDKTVDFIKKFAHLDLRVKLTRSKINRGPYSALNLLLTYAKGKYIAIQDHDDLWLKDKLKLQVDFLERNKDFSFCGGVPAVYFEKYHEVSIPSWKEGKAVTVPHPTLMFRNTEGLKYDLSVRYKTDQYFMKYILSKIGKGGFLLGCVLYVKRVRSDGQNLSFKWLTMNGLLSYLIKSYDITIVLRTLIKLFFINFFSPEFYFRSIVYRGKKMVWSDFSSKFKLDFL